MRVFSYVYGFLIACFAAVLVWAFFDVHERYIYAIMAQAPVLVCRAVWICIRRAPVPAGGAPE